MRDLYEQIEAFAQSSAPVLIVGETGAGKELVARALHGQSPRSQGPFVPVNAGALPETMMESELFGHAKGAFTGAEADREGKLMVASRGTLLLDEVEALSERAQIQLLRVLEDGWVHPLGVDQPRKVDIRLLTTTNLDLIGWVKKGRMRQDFFHRIVVLTLHVPSLRERMEDMPLLAAHFCREAAARSGIPVPSISDKCLADLLAYPWPGNVRELRNAVERMVFTAQAGSVGPFIPDSEAEASRLLSLPTTAGRLKEELERTERAVIEAALREQRGEINATSRSLGISRRALYERMKKYDLQKQDFKS
jgi:two-component system C4-dicarboxylate transport response regulator DctD